jgi:hypothetical protein
MESSKIYHGDTEGTEFHGGKRETGDGRKAVGGNRV